jgi:hypothetical protein
MTTDEQLDERISEWLEAEAPGRMPDRVLRATFERTRKSRQHLGWQALLARARVTRRATAFGATAVLAVAVLGAGMYVSRPGIASRPSPTPEASPTLAASPSVEPSAPPDPLWPQSSLEEVRTAQKLADAGDPAYTWQRFVDGHQVAQNHPCSGTGNRCWSPARSDGGVAVFTRFLEDVLGWEAFSWDEAFAHPEGLEDGDVVFVRCAPGSANPLYPTDPERPDCAPTIDELRYETVKIHVAQPDRQGPTGIWVVTGWEMIEPAEQTAPPSDAEIGALLDAFLQARIDGKDAEGFVDFAENDPLASERVDRGIPLLYATSTGAAFERSAFEVVDGPVWPEGQMWVKVRFLAEGGATVVEQVFSLQRDQAGGLRLVYDPAGDPTTENGQPVPVKYGFLDGAVTYRAAYPLEPSQDGYRQWDRLAIEGLLPDDDAPRRILTFLADPRPIGTGCAGTPGAADAEELARSIRSDPDFEATAQVAVTIGGRSAVQIDGVAAFATSCGVRLYPAGGTRARVYLLDLPGGSQARVLAIAIVTDRDSFEPVLESAAPIMDSIEFHSP